MLNHLKSFVHLAGNILANFPSPAIIHNVMKNNKLHTKILASFLCFLVLLTLCAPIFAQGRQGQPSQQGQLDRQNLPLQSLNIIDSKKPSAIIPWGVGGLLAAGVVAIGFKNAKRSHLD